MKQYLIADSGGTKTDWCLIDRNDRKEFFTSESYHPVHWDKDFFNRNRMYWEKIKGKEDITVCFFGAGCFHTENCLEISRFFETIGFRSVEIYSDLHSAAISSYGENNGRVAILGTGSVLFDWNNGEIVHRIGGKGHLYGDEGSGYYFGKLIIERFRNNLLNEYQIKCIKKLNIDQIDLNDKFKVANISKLLSNEKKGFSIVHRQNIEVFIVSHDLLLSKDKLSIVGSYGFHHQEIIRSVFERNGLTVSLFIEKPIFCLVEYRAVFID